MSQGDSSIAQSSQVAVFGLAVMGSNLARNIESRGIPVVVYNRSTEVTEKFLSEFGEGQFISATSLAELIEKTERPRQIILMIKAGKPVDAVLDELIPLLSKGDSVIDGGNAYYQDTRRRVELCLEKGIHFIGMGVSGGEEGALKGPSLMPGGDREAWKNLAPLLEKIAAAAEGEPCTDYVGPDGSGHFVKMVHNGIEYADMQLIAEVYHLMRDGLELPNSEIASWFQEWNDGRLSSFLMEITYKIARKGDPDGGEGELLDVILDKAGQKGTGRWTVQESLELGVPIPTIAAAVDARGLSALKEERIAASKVYTSRGADPKKFRELFATPEGAKAALEQSLYVGKVIAYAQGMSLIGQASREFDWSLKLDKVAALWRAGCIIRASLLQVIMQAFEKEPELPNLVMCPTFREQLVHDLGGLRSVVSGGVQSGIPLPALAASLNYLDAYTLERLPQNMIQAQRDFFGAHTYQRTDKDGTFHTEWE